MSLRSMHGVDCHGRSSILYLAPMHDSHGCAHPVGTRAAQLVGSRRLLGPDRFGPLHEETPHHAPQARTVNAGVAILAKAGDQRCFLVPARRRHRKISLYQILVKCAARKRWQRETGTDAFSWEALCITDWSNLIMSLICLCCIKIAPFDCPHMPSRTLFRENLLWPE
jgi:hypothetical protein